MGFDVLSFKEGEAVGAMGGDGLEWGLRLLGCLF